MPAVPTAPKANIARYALGTSVATRMTSGWPDQAELMFNAVRDKGLPTAYLPFEGEQHGFRQAKNIKRALDAQLYFFSRVFGFELAEPVEPVTIENL